MPILTSCTKQVFDIWLKAYKIQHLKVEGTPIDTTFSGVTITSLRDSYTNFESAYFYISNNSPDENMKILTEHAIRGLFSTLDPHSVFIEADDSEQDQENFAGKFQELE